MTSIAELQQRIQIFEISYYIAIQGISYVDCITNDAIKETIKQGISQLENLISTVKKRKLKWYGHIKRANLSTAILQFITLSKRRPRGKKDGLTMSLKALKDHSH